jgi:hypothetical protein
VNSVRARAAYVMTMSMVVLVALAAPAAAAPAISGSAVLANEQFKWFYWIGFILAFSMALWLLRTAVMYYVKVVRPKHRGRETS